MNDDYNFDSNLEDVQDIPLRSGALQGSFILQPISSLMHQSVGTVNINQTVKEAVMHMTNGGYGCTIVMEDKQLVGIFTERDVMTRIVAMDVNPNTAIISDYMTPNPECIEVEDPVAYALNLMAVGNFRHVPVVDEDYKLVGIFSIRDLQSEIIGHFEKEILTLPPKPVRQGPSRRFGG